MNDLSDRLADLLGGYLPNVLAAIAILLLGWLASLLLASLARGGVNRLAARRAPGEAPHAMLQAPRAGVVVGRIVFYTALVFVIAGAFQALQLSAVSGPLDAMLERFTAYLPQVVGALILLGIGVLVASGLRFAASKGLEVSRLGEKIASSAGMDEGRPLSKTVGEVVFWVTLLVFLPAVLGVLELDGLVAPLQTMFDDLLSVLPDLVGAGLILLIGWFLARVMRAIVTGLLASGGADRFGARFGMGPEAGARRLSSVAGLLVYAFILIPAAIAAFDALRIESVSGPATRMLEQVMSSIPLLFAAGVLITIAYLVGRVLANLVTGVLTGLGFDGLFSRLGLRLGTGERTPSQLAGTLLLVALLLVAGIEAAALLGFGALADLTEQFFAFGARLLLSLVILGIGLYLANLAYEVVPRSEGRLPTAYASAARIAIVVLAATMALQNIGVADEIVTLAFGLVLGAVAVAAAIAFGLGSRDAARRIVEDLMPQSKA